MDRRWIVTTSGNRSIAAVADDLLRHGFTTEQTLGEINVLIGRAEEARVGQLSGVADVVDIAPEAPIDVGPPDDPATW